MIRRFFAIRHGETEDNVGGIAQGWTDSPLTDKGLAQVRAAASRVRTFEPSSIWASPLPRAAETARIIGEAAGIEPRTLEELKEVHCGDWEGRPFTEVRREDRDYFERWIADPSMPCPGGESLADVRDRMRAAVDRIGNGEAGERPLVVSHATSIKVLTTVLLGWPLEAVRKLVKANTGISTFHRHEGEYYLVRWNDHTHIEELKIEK